MSVEAPRTTRSCVAADASAKIAFMKSSSLTPVQERTLATALDLEERYKAAAEESESLCSERNDAVLRAINLNVRPARIAAHLGLSSSRIGQIKRRAA